MKVDGSLKIDVSYTEVKTIQEMLKKAEPMPAIRKKFHVANSYWYECPACGWQISQTDRYCSKCGQKIDEENIAL